MSRLSNFRKILADRPLGLNVASRAPFDCPRGLISRRVHHFSHYKPQEATMPILVPSALKGTALLGATAYAHGTVRPALALTSPLTADLTGLAARRHVTTAGTPLMCVAGIALSTLWTIPAGPRSATTSARRPSTYRIQCQAKYQLPHGGFRGLSQSLRPRLRTSVASATATGTEAFSRLTETQRRPA